MWTSIILSWIYPIVIPALIIAGVASYIMIRVFGVYIAIVLFCIASAYGAYEFGYADRGKLDKSGQLQGQLELANADLAIAKKSALSMQKITSDANAREALATSASNDLQTKVDAYEKTIAEQASVPPDTSAGKCAPVRQNACALSAADVRSLRAIAARSSVGK